MDQRFVRLACTTVLTSILGAVIAIAQGPTFEVAAIKENKSGSQSTAVQSGQGGRFTAMNVSLVRLIRNAYGNPMPLQPFQVAAPPEPWMSNDPFDVNATAGIGANPSLADSNLMLQSLLRDRFKLVVHREMRQMPVFVLKPARSDGRLGPHLEPSTLNCQSPEDKSKCGYRGYATRITAGAVRIAQLTTALTQLIREQLVIDRSGLDGLYDLEVTYSGLPGRPPVPDSELPSLPVALEEQLGLTLASERAPVEVIVIDRAERPIPD